ncbi:MAG: DMT family transporter [Anaerolineaceae bacterium]|nr:MAG: DMT family transporter [Anaerolineaceae bacterium]
MPKSKVIPYLEVTFAVVVWGATFIATKIALREVSPATIVWLRFAMGTAILGAVVIARRQFALPEKREWLYLVMLGFIGVTFHQWLQATGLQTAKATTTAWIVATTPVFIALLGWLALKEKLNWVQTGGIAVAAFGVLLIVSKGNFSALFAGEEGTFGDLLIFISALNWAVYTILSRRELARHPAARMMFFVMLLGWLFTNIWIFGFGPGTSEIKNLTSSGWNAVLVLGVFGSGLAYIAFYDALQAIPASQLGAFFNIEPLVTALLAAFMINEAITAVSLIGGAIIILGVWLVNRKGK